MKEDNKETPVLTQETRITPITGRSISAKSRRKKNITEDTLMMQERLVDSKCFLSVAEIAFRMANESWQGMKIAAAEKGKDSPEYDRWWNRTNTATKTALPYFASALSSTQLSALDDDVSTDDVQTELAKILAKRKAQ